MSTTTTKKTLKIKSSFNKSFFKSKIFFGFIYFYYEILKSKIYISNNIYTYTFIILFD